jgi:hypothetical protein
MAVADRVSFFSRFTMKFVEVIGAGIATAITGYLIAHLGGFWPAPAPAALQSAPSVSTISKTSIFKSSRAQPVAPVATDADAKEHAAKPTAGPSRDANAPTAQPARATAAATATPLPARKSATDIGAIESKPRDAEGKPRDAESVEEQVRAALAKVDAMRPRPPEPAAHQLEISPATPAVAIQPRPAEPAVGSIAAVPPAAAIAPQLAPQPAQLAPVAPLPLGTVEIKSQPVADVAATPTPPAPDNAQASAPEDKGILATLKKIPDMLRPASGATTTPPRPPLPVGQ